MPTFNIAAGIKSRNHQVPAGSVVTVTPVPGGSALVEYTIANDTSVANNTAVWSQWPKGTVGAATSDYANDPLWVRVTASGGAAVLNIEYTPAQLAQDPYRRDWASSVLNAGIPGVSSDGKYAYVGQVLTAVPPTGVLPSGFQWYRDTGSGPIAISGATSVTYTRTSSDVPVIAGPNISISVVVTSSQTMSTASVSYPPLPGDMYARFRSAMAAAAAGTGYARAGVFGDSTSAGYGAVGATPVRAETPAVYLKTALAAIQNAPVVASNFIADQSFSATNGVSVFTFDNRLSQPDGASYASENATKTVAGSVIRNSGNTGRMGFLPEIPVDTFDVYYPVNPGLSNFSLARTGATTINVSPAGTTATAKVTLNSPLDGTNPLYFSGTGSYLIGADAYNSAVKSIRVLGLGWAGGKMSDWIANTNGFDPLPALNALGLDLVVIRPGINDYVNGTAVATFKTQLGILVDSAIAAGTNVVLATFYPSKTNQAPQATQDTFAQAIRDVAAARGLKVRDTYAAWGTWVAANALGYMFDDLHPNKVGYQAEATALAAFIKAL